MEIFLTNILDSTKYQNLSIYEHDLLLWGLDILYDSSFDTHNTLFVLHVVKNAWYE